MVSDWQFDGPYNSIEDLKLVPSVALPTANCYQPFIPLQEIYDRAPELFHPCDLSLGLGKLDISLVGKE